jgi:hypothetical protein
MPAIAAARIHRAQINRANSEHSTGPRTASGKQRSSQNSLRHGLTARTAILPSDDRAAYDRHHRQFLDEYQPATATETQLVTELADTSWRLNRISLLDAALLDQPVPSPESLIPALASLGLHGARLSRQFQKTLDHLREIQAERRDQERRELKDAAAILVYHQHKGLPWEPADHGFVFSKDQVERFSQRMMRQNQSRQVAYGRFYMPYRPIPSGERHPSAAAPDAS